MPTHRGRRAVEVAASAEACFAAMTDYEDMPRWQRSLKAVRVLERGPGTDVVEFTVDARVKTFAYRLRLRYDRPHGIDSDYLGGPFRDFEAGWRFEDLGAGRARATVDVHLDPGRLIPRAVARIVEDALLGRAVDDLRRRVEEGPRG